VEWDDRGAVGADGDLCVGGVRTGFSGSGGAAEGDGDIDKIKNKLMAEQEVIKHVKEAVAISKDKTKKWQTKVLEILLEIGIIVFAVTLSIWLHNWSDSNKDREEEREFLVGLKGDLRADMVEMKSDSAAYRLEQKAVGYFLRVGAGEAVNKDSISFYRDLLFGDAQIYPRSSRFEALKGSGRMSIIRNKQLLLDITDLYSKDFPAIERRNDYVNSLRESSLIPFVDSHLQLDVAGHATNWQELLQMPQMRLMVTAQGTISNNIETYGVGIEKCEDIIREIDEQLD
jgi:hypothetical protein